MREFLRLSAALAACWVLVTGAADSRGGLESNVLAEINYARQHPQQYAERLRDYRERFEGRILYLPGDDNGVVTSEGSAAVDEAIAFLERQAPLPPLDAGELLMLAARDHADDQGAAGATGHVSRDGAGPGERVRRRGGDIFVGESIYYGSARPDQVVRSLIVDDGVPGRGHRALLFKRDFRFAGIGCAEHRRFGSMCVVDLSGTRDGGPVLPAGAQTFRWGQAQAARTALATR